MFLANFVSENSKAMNISINTIDKLLDSLSIEEKVAQCMMIGFDGINLESKTNHYTRNFLAKGIGGIIFFGVNCRPCKTSEEIKRLINTLKQTIHIKRSL